MLKLDRIYLERAEGPRESVGRPMLLADFESANAQLRRWAETAPQGGGYDKVDYRISWEGGLSWSGRYDLKHLSIDPCDLEAHAKECLAFYAGLAKPGHMTDQDYERVIALRPEPLRESLGMLLQEGFENSRQRVAARP